jgi:hypothetical protein
MHRFAVSRPAMASSAPSAVSRQQPSVHQARILQQLPAYVTEQQRSTVMMHDFGALDVLDVNLQVFEGAKPEAAQAITFIRSRGWFRIRTAKAATRTEDGPRAIEHANLYFNPRGGCVAGVFTALMDEVSLVRMSCTSLSHS